MEQKIELAQKRLAKLEKAIANLLDMAELHPSVDLIRRLNEREAERDSVQQEIDLLYQQVKQDRLRVDEELILRELTEMRNTLGGGEFKVQKIVLKKTIDKIEVGPHHARLHYKFPLSILLFKRVRGVVSKVRQNDLMLVEL
jgi:serine phosphatase RsbU (regulator of sigma subunit)